MAIVRSDPFRELVQLQDQLFRAFDAQQGLRRGTGTGTEEGLGAAWQPAVDVFEDADSVQLQVEVPGVDPKDIQIQVEGNTLTIRGERRLEKEDKRENYQRIERVYGAFSRTFTLPSIVDVEHISAEGKDGVLRVVLPKKAETKPRQIKVQAGAPQIGSGGSGTPQKH
ncbi:MAG TPA: Hsp20/alpha crystallin family protein [Myxococcales bacterium]|nr:Hsp20/alpha crystallin family protein [Myxococcales bacterium]